MSDQPLTIEQIAALPDTEFLNALRKLHQAFILHICNVMARGKVHRSSFHTVAQSIAEGHDYVFLCGRIYIPVCFQERLMKLLNEQQQQFNQFQDNDKIQEQLEGQEKEGRKN